MAFVNFANPVGFPDISCNSPAVSLGVIALAVMLGGLLASIVVTRMRRQMRLLRQSHDGLAQTNRALEARIASLVQELEQANAQGENERQRAEALLQDAAHRIGNSLATVSSLLSLQVLRTPSSEIREALESASARVYAIASAHRRLRLGNDIATVDTSDFLDAILSDLARTLTSDDHITLTGQFDAIVINSRDATTVGILLGELVTNAIKHAFRRTEGGTIAVTFKLIGGVPTLSVRDDGDGLAAGQTAGGGGLGAVVIKQLAGQFGGTPLYEQPLQGGLRVVIPLPGLIDATPQSS